MIESEFEDAIRTEAVGFSHGDFGLVVRALDDVARDQLSCPEIVEDELAVLAQRATFFMGSMRDRMVWRHHSSRNFPAQAGEL